MASTQGSGDIPPPTISGSLLREEQWRIPENLVFDVENLVKGSFESEFWTWNGRDQIIKSSLNQHYERQLLHGFLGALKNGGEAADARDFVSAGSFWQDAFETVDHLVQGRYHDIIPNLIQKIKDLDREGRKELARILQQHISECGRSYLGPNSSTISIYTGLSHLDMSYMSIME